MKLPEKLWYVGKKTDESDNSWEFQGVFDDEEKAIEACEYDDYFVIGPIEINIVLPRETFDYNDDNSVETVGWYPKLESKPDKDIIK